MAEQMPDSKPRDSRSPDRKSSSNGPVEGFLSAVAFIFLWNSGFIGAEYVLPNVEPLTLLFWRYWTLCLFLAPYLALRGQLRWPGKGMVAHSCILGILAHGTWLGCVTYALQYNVPAGLVALIVALQPLLTGALAGILAGEPISRLQWVGSVIGFGGVLITVSMRIDFEQPETIFAYLLPFGSVLAITLATLLERRRVKFQDPDRIPLGLSLFYQSLGTALVVTLPAYFFEGMQTKVDTAFVLSMLWLVLAVSLAAYALMWHLVARLNATREASLFYLGPPLTMIMAWIVFGDTITTWDLLGLLTVAVGVSLANLPERVRPSDRKYSGS